MNSHGARQALVFAALLFALVVAPRAGAAQSPAWTVTVRQDVPTADSTVGSRRSWDALPDGGAVVLSFGQYAFYVRDIDAGGRVRSVARGSLSGAGVSQQIASALLRRHPDGGALALFGDGHNCALVRVDGEGSTRWKRLPAQDTPYASECRDLHVLPDGSALVLRESALTRIDADGNTLWTVRNGDDGRYFGANDFLVDAHGVVWVASRGGLIGGGSNEAAVLRFRLDGSRAGEDYFLCSQCIANLTLGVAVLAAGDVIAVGGAGTGQPGFVARYAPDGTRRYVNVGAPGVNYLEVVVDAQDRVYARSEEPPTIHRLDADDGHALWSRAGTTIAALPGGVLTTTFEGPGNNQLNAIAYDPAGARTWTGSLAVGSASAGAALADATGVTVPVQDWQPPRCKSPSLVRLDNTGAVVGSRQACITPGATYTQAISARADVGVLSDLQSGLVAHTPAGVETWRMPVCDACNVGASGTVHRTPAVLRADGGARAVRGTIGTYWPATAEALERIDAAGNVVAATPLVASGVSSQRVRLLDSAPDAWVLLPGNGRVDWQRVDNEGVVIASGGIELPSGAFVTWVADARRTSDGGVTIALQHTVSEICFDPCFPVYSVVLRVKSHGDLAWIHEAPEPDGALLADDDGGAFHVHSDGTFSNNEMEHIDGNGNVGASIPLPGVLGGYLQLAGPFGGRLLIASPTSIYAINRDGSELVARAGPASLLAGRADGVLIRDYARADLEAEWLDPSTLQTLAELDLASATDASPYAVGAWTALDSGEVYGLKNVMAADDQVRATVMRFTAPGGTSGWLFADGFE